MKAPPSSQASPHFWVGRMAAAMGEAAQVARDDPKWTQSFLRSALAEFIASPVPAEETRVMLRRYLK